MKTLGLPDTQLVDLISGRLLAACRDLHARMDPAAAEALADVLPELGLEIAKAVAAAIQANNAKVAEQSAHAESRVPVSSTQFYDQLSASIDGY